MVVGQGCVIQGGQKIKAEPHPLFSSRRKMTQCSVVEQLNDVIKQWLVDVLCNLVLH